MWLAKELGTTIKDLKEMDIALCKFTKSVSEKSTFKTSHKIYPLQIAHHQPLKKIISSLRLSHPNPPPSPIFPAWNHEQKIHSVNRISMTPFDFFNPNCMHIAYVLEVSL
jgi:hypothetical protein